LTIKRNEKKERKREERCEERVEEDANYMRRRRRNRVE
jgi:hypothetical protein